MKIKPLVKAILFALAEQKMGRVARFKGMYLIPLGFEIG